jgi:hypothetical protein
VGDSKKTVAELMGDALREIAILSAVFFMLDKLMKDDPANTASLTVTLLVLAGCIITFSVGVLFEVLRVSND